MKTRCAALLLAICAPVSGGIVTHAQLCAQGDLGSCRIVELAKQIDMTQFREDGPYKWAMGPHMLWSTLPADKAEKRAALNQAACTFYNQLWLGPIVAEYERLTDARAVDRAHYYQCLQLLQ
jgi:hypothetical protein